MKCLKCGTENSESSSFCVQCGEKLGNLNENNAVNEDVSTVNANIQSNEGNENIIDNSTNDINSISAENSDTIVNNSTTNNNYLNAENINSTSSIEAPTLNNRSNVSNNQTNMNQKKSHTGIIILIILLLLIIIGISIFLIWNNNNNKNKTNNINIDNNNPINNNNSTTDNNTSDNTKNSNSNSTTSSDFVVSFNNYNVDIDMTMEISGISTTANFTGTVDEKNQIEYLKMSMNLMGFELSTETYSDIKNGITYIYEPFSDEWFKENEASKMINLNNLLQSLKSMKDVQIIDDNHFKVKITNDDIKGLLETSDVTTGSITGDIYADVYTNNGYVEKIVYDFSNMTQVFDGLTLEMRISNYDKAGSVQIPSEAINSATEY